MFYEWKFTTVKNWGGGGTSKYYLTEEQKKVVDENHNLIYSFLNTYNLSIDEYYDVAAIGLCKAAATYNSNKGNKLSAYAYSIMLNEVKMVKRKYCRTSTIPVNLIRNLDSEIFNNNGDSFTLAETISSNEDHTVEVQYKIIINEYFNKIRKRDKEIILEILEGNKQETVARHYNISRSYVSRIYNRFKKYIKEIKESENF